MEKPYLGDGVYVEHDGFAFVLTTEDGIRVTNRIVLEPEVYTALAKWARDLATRATRGKAK
jgi:hypothetical protein